MKQSIKRTVDITKSEMDNLLRSEKGWICNKSGNEYIYDFHLKNYPIIIKVASSVMVDIYNRPNKGSDCIHVFAVCKKGLEVKSPIIGGILSSKKRVVLKTTGWQNRLKEKVNSAIKVAKWAYVKRQE